MDKELENIRIAVKEIARAVETGDTEGLNMHIKRILGSAPHLDSPVTPKPRCNCAKCHAIWNGENNGDDGVN